MNKPLNFTQYQPRRLVRRALGSMVFVALFWGLAAFDAGPGGSAWAASALSPRHSGLEAPGGPKPMEGLPGGSTGRTTEGGGGYTDAYGNPVENREPEAKAPRQRTHPGAYGGYGRSKADNRPLPEPDSAPESPAWSFN